MSAMSPATRPVTSQQAAVEAALLVLERMGLSAADLLSVPAGRPELPTFAEYVPVVAGAVSAGTRRAYGSYWNRVVEQWGGRRLDEPTPSEIRQLMAHVKAHVVPRRNARGGPVGQLTRAGPGLQVRPVRRVQRPGQLVTGQLVHRLHRGRVLQLRGRLGPLARTAGSGGGRGVRRLSAR
jgi:hypothetical protein